jgi:hypothetical protein
MNVTNEDRLRTAVLLLLDAVDYTSGACTVTEKVGAVLSTDLIQIARTILKETEPTSSASNPRSSPRRRVSRS